MGCSCQEIDYKRTKKKSKVQTLSPNTRSIPKRGGDVQACQSLCPRIPQQTGYKHRHLEESPGVDQHLRLGFPPDPVPNSGEPLVDQQWHYIKAPEKQNFRTLKTFHNMTKHKAFAWQVFCVLSGYINPSSHPSIHPNLSCTNSKKEHTLRWSLLLCCFEPNELRSKAPELYCFFSALQKEKKMQLSLRCCEWSSSSAKFEFLIWTS